VKSPSVTEARTRDWRWQNQHQIRSLDELAERLPGVRITDGMRRAAAKYPFTMTPYVLSLIETPCPTDPIFRQYVPDEAELAKNRLSPDELGEDSRYSPVRGLVHRYADRVVSISSALCPAYCRHCTRKRLVGRPESASSSSDLDRQVEYVREHPGVRDVIISGGDPLSLATACLDRVIARFRAIPSVDIIRIGTRAPVTLPMRIDDELCEMLERHHPVWVNTQFNHPREVTAESATACDRLLRHGIPVGNQTVLLRGVNDRPDAMEALCRALLRIRVRPYYLLQCDPVAGTTHFRTPVSRGFEIMEHLHKSVGGLGVPRYVVDAVNGGGKLPIGPGYVISHEDGVLTLRNFEGQIVTYTDSAGCSAES